MVGKARSLGIAGNDEFIQEQEGVELGKRRCADGAVDGNSLAFGQFLGR